MTKEEQKTVGLIAKYREPAFRRWRVFSTFATGSLIGLFYVLLISEKVLPGLAPDGQRSLVLIFSGILGGVIYTILVDGHVEMPQFIENGNKFEAGLFGDILLGIAGATVLAYIAETLDSDFLENIENVELAAVGLVGGYGGRAILQFALNRVFKNVNMLQADREKYLQASYQKRLERLDGLQLIKGLNQQIKVGLSSAEWDELSQEIRQASANVKKQVFELAKDFRRTATLAGETGRIERTIPVFKTLIDSDPNAYRYYAQLGFAYKDSAVPDLFNAIQYLDKAIDLRGEKHRAETWKYELSRAIAQIQNSYNTLASYDFDSVTNQRIMQDLLSVAEIYNLENILKAAEAKRIPTPILAWMQHHRAMLASNPEAKALTATLLGSTVGMSRAVEPSRMVTSTTSIPQQQGTKPAVLNDKSVPQAALDLIKKFEGYHKELPDGRAEAYPDPKDGWAVPTIGYGTTRYPDGKSVAPGQIITHAEAEEYLRWEVEDRCRSVLEKIPTWKQMNANQRAAIYSFAYNLGVFFYNSGADFASITRVCDSPEKWNNRQWIADQFVKYRNPGSSVEAGLKRRRLAEAALFCQPVSDSLLKKENVTETTVASQLLSAATGPVGQRLSEVTLVLEGVNGVYVFPNWRDELKSAVCDGLMMLGFLEATEQDDDDLLLAWGKFKKSAQLTGYSQLDFESAQALLKSLKRSSALTDSVSSNRRNLENIGMTIPQVISGCDTGQIQGLSLQVLDKIIKDKPDVLTKIDHPLIFCTGEQNNPYLQVGAYQALVKMVEARNQPLHINSCLRTPMQQHMLRQQYEQGICGITAAARPPLSNHNSGLAIDVEDPYGWKPFMTEQNWKWLGAWDEVHFDYIGADRETLGELQVRAFQELWNEFNPQETIEVDGAWGPTTMDKANKSPIQGFGNPPVFKKGAFSETVGKLQLMLSTVLKLSPGQLTVDNHFGSQTFKAVSKFQEQMGLTPVDGVVGPKTLQKLEELSGKHLF